MLQFTFIHYLYALLFTHSKNVEIQVKKITIKGSIISRNQDFKTKVIENNNKKKSVESFKEDMEQS